jgi:hypothetical protein
MRWKHQSFVFTLWGGHLTRLDKSVGKCLVISYDWGCFVRDMTMGWLMFNCIMLMKGWVW